MNYILKIISWDDIVLFFGLFINRNSNNKYKYTF